LEFDSIRYFAISDCLEHGCAPGSRAANDFLPHGYPDLLFLLSKIGLQNSFCIAFINGCYLLCGLYFVQQILKPGHPYFFFVIILLHWTVIKLFAYPLSEMQYLFFSSASLYFYSKFHHDKRWRSFSLAVFLAIPAMLTRSIGIALFIALFLGLVWDNRGTITDKQNRAGVLVVAILLITAAIFGLSRITEWNHYAKFLFKNNVTSGHILSVLSMHLKEWGQLFLNIPIGKVEGYFPKVVASIIFLVAGIAGLIWFICSLIRQRSEASSVVIIYMIVYSVIIFNWPYSDPRFWLPVLPFVICIILKSAMNKLKPAKIVFVCLYIVMGVSALSYSLYTQFNKEAFARNQAKGIFRNEYEMYFFGKTMSDTASRVDAYVLDVLNRTGKSRP